MIGAQPEITVAIQAVFREISLIPHVLAYGMTNIRYSSSEKMSYRWGTMGIFGGAGSDQDRSL